MSKTSKAWYEDFANFFEEPSREKLREFLKNHVGESDKFDFKQEWPKLSKVGRNILGLANSGGGCLFIGIKEKKDKTFDPVGINKLLDKADLQKGIQKFIPTQVKYEAVDFSYDDSEYPKIVGKKFQIIFVENLPEYIPFISKADGEGIQRDIIYVRRGTNTEKANYEELQEIINRRLETGYSSQEEFDLNKHLAELKALYDYIPRYAPRFDLGVASVRLLGQDQNPKYPTEDFETFVNRLISTKKSVIETLISQK